MDECREELEFLSIRENLQAVLCHLLPEDPEVAKEMARYINYPDAKLKVSEIKIIEKLIYKYQLEIVAECPCELPENAKMKFCSSCRDRSKLYCDEICFKRSWKKHAYICKKTCSFCHKVAEFKNLKKCAGCKHRRYCHRGCQKADWKRRHKAECANS